MEIHKNFTASKKPRMPSLRRYGIASFAMVTLLSAISDLGNWISSLPLSRIASDEFIGKDNTLLPYEMPTFHILAGSILVNDAVASVMM